MFIDKRWHIQKEDNMYKIGHENYSASKKECNNSTGGSF